MSHSIIRYGIWLIESADICIRPIYSCTALSWSSIICTLLRHGLLMTDLELEFEHIYIEARAERWPLIERFLFSYFCMREGYLSKQGKPDWELARSNTIHSKSVTHLKCSELEPLVPLAVIIGEIKRYQRDGELTPSVLQRILNSLLHYAVISKDEKSALRKAGLLNTMPADWYQSDAKDLYSRFLKVGIQLLPSWVLYSHIYNTIRNWLAL